MTLDKNLTFAEKYNWWSSERGSISLETKISYIMTQGKLEELYFVFKNFDVAELKKGFVKVENDNFVLKSRRRGVIKTFFEEKSRGRL